MQVEVFRFSRKAGWSISKWPELDSPQTAIFVFAAPGVFNAPQPLQGLIEAYPNSHVIGCSTAGEILGGATEEGGVVGAIVRFRESRLKTVRVPVKEPSESWLAGCSLGQALRSEDLRAAFVLSDGLCVDGASLVSGIRTVLGAEVCVLGGLAADGDAFRETWVLESGQCGHGVVAALGLYGDKIRARAASGGGWLAFGPERLVTRARGNVVYEFDGKPALALYKDYLGKLAEELPSAGLLFPIAIRGQDTDEEKIVRTLLGVDEVEQSITFAGHVPEGCIAQLMRANGDQLLEAAIAVGESFGDKQISDTETLSLVVSCVGRKQVLGERADEEAEALLAGLPANVKQIGFYSYGEISPTAAGRCEFHNQTLSVIQLGEA